MTKTKIRRDFLGSKYFFASQYMQQHLIPHQQKCSDISRLLDYPQCDFIGLSVCVSISFCDFLCLLSISAKLAPKHFKVLRSEINWLNIGVKDKNALNVKLGNFLIGFSCYEVLLCFICYTTCYCCKCYCSLSLKNEPISSQKL